MNTLVFDNSTKQVILRVFGKGIDKQGYIFDLAINQRVVTPEGNEVLADDFAGIRKGSEIIYY